MVDIMSSEKRSKLMSRIKGKNTGPERLLSSALHKQGLRFRRHSSELPGRPDFVFPGAKVVVFVDGDFWHGWNFKQWKGKLSPFWRDKIQGNIERDRKNRRRLKRMGWSCLCFWEHEIENELDLCVTRVRTLLEEKVCG